MEHHQYQQQQHEENINSSNMMNGNSGGVGGCGGTTSKSTFLCRQSSTRWIPTTDQIRILKDLYYNSGVRSPSAEQIQRISARLRQYGKIEGKNVFYWFQNHKARERQKKRLTVEINSAASNNKKFPNSISPGLSPTTPGYGVGQIGGNGCGGSMLMERSFRECSLSGGVGAPVMEGNIGWVGVEEAAAAAAAAMPQCYYHHQQRPIYYYEDSSCYYNYNHFHQRREEEEEHELTRGVDSSSAAAQIETLPLFPIHHADEQQEQGRGEYGSTGYSCHAFYSDHGGVEEEHLHYSNHIYSNSVANASDTASLELTLNSYYAPPGST